MEEVMTGEEGAEKVTRLKHEEDTHFRTWARNGRKLHKFWSLSRFIRL